MADDELEPLVPGTDAPLPDGRRDESTPPRRRLGTVVRQPPVPGFLFLAALALAFGADAVALRSPNETRAEVQRAAVTHQPPDYESSLWIVRRAGSLGPDLRWELSTYADRNAGITCARLLVLDPRAPSREYAVHWSGGRAHCREDGEPPLALETDPATEACRVGLPGQFTRQPRLSGVCPSLKEAAIDFMLRAISRGPAEVIGAEFFRDQGLSAMVLASGGDGASQRVFFFLDGKYVSTDAPLLSERTYSSSVGPEAGNGDTVAVNYLLYRPDDPTCCPSGGAARVRYRWTGSEVEALDPIPPRRGDGVPAGR